MKTCLTYRAQTRKARKSAISRVHTGMAAQTRKARKSAVSSVHTGIAGQKKRQVHLQHRGAEMKVLGQGGNGRALHKMEYHLG